MEEGVELESNTTSAYIHAKGATTQILCVPGICPVSGVPGVASRLIAPYAMQYVRKHVKSAGLVNRRKMSNGMIYQSIPNKCTSDGYFRILQGTAV